MTALIWWRRSQSRVAAGEYALSASGAPGRVLGRPGPGRTILIWLSSGISSRQSPRWPGVTSRATGHREPAARWILVLSPPRDRPIASRSVPWACSSRPLLAPGGSRSVRALIGFLSFDPALSYQLGRRCPARPRSVQVRPEHRGIRAERPARALAPVAPGPGSCPTSRRCRPYTVFQEPYSPGRSRRGHPALVRNKIPLTTVR